MIFEKECTCKRYEYSMTGFCGKCGGSERQTVFGPIPRSQPKRSKPSVVKIIKEICKLIKLSFTKKKTISKFTARKVCSCGKYRPVSKSGRFTDSTCANCGGRQPRSYTMNRSSRFDRDPAIGE